MCQEYPWLLKIGQGRKPKRRARPRMPRGPGAKRILDDVDSASESSSSKSGSGEDDHEHMFKKVFRKVLDEIPDGILDGDEMRELAEHRAYWAWDDAGVNNFTVVNLGGRWTKAFCAEKPYNGAVGMARGGEVKEWCIMNYYPRQKGFMYSVWGEEAANELAREFCRRGQHFYNCWQLRDPDVPFVWDEFHVAAYAECAAFTKFADELDPDSPACAMVMEMRETLRPFSDGDR